jgi:hypothetical protein
VFVTVRVGGAVAPVLVTVQEPGAAWNWPLFAQVSVNTVPVVAVPVVNE